MRALCLGLLLGASAAEAQEMAKLFTDQGKTYLRSDNAASLRFHERLGFERVAHLREVGFKFGRWLDLVFVQRVLTP